MTYDQGLVHRIEQIINNSDFSKKKMFGGIVWFLNGNMCTGVHKDYLILRLGEKNAASISDNKHVSAMDITGKPMKGWVKVVAKDTWDDTVLKNYINLAVEFVNSLPSK